MSALDELLRNSGVVVQRGGGTGADPHRVFLHAGQVFTAVEPTQVTTIVGSCVAICLWDVRSRIGGMNHYMLPHDIGAHFATPRYANHATRLLMDQLRAAGADLKSAQAKIFGGARILSSSAADNDLGTLNVAIARQLLREAGIKVVEQQTGGTEGRKVTYQTATGLTTVTMVSRGWK